MARRTTSYEDQELADYIGEEMTLDAGKILDYVSRNFEPGDVFDDVDLENWARENGFIKEDECPEGD
jgi:hypothetical protein